MASPFIAPLISGVTGLINTIGSKRRAKRNVRQSVAATKELADYTYQQDLAQWHRQNQYNMPRSQMQRLREANLNPNLVYGTGTVTGNTAGQQPKYQQQVADYSGVPALQVPNYIGESQSIKKTDAEINLLQEQERNTREATLNTMAERMGITARGFKDTIGNLTYGALQRTQLQSAQLTNQQKRENIRLTGRTVEQRVLQNELLEIRKRIEKSGKVGTYGNLRRNVESIAKELKIPFQQAMQEAVEVFQSLPKKLFNDAMDLLNLR